MDTTECRVRALHSHRVLRRRFAEAVLKIVNVTLAGCRAQATLSVSDVPQRPIFESWLRTLTLRVCDPSTGYLGSASFGEVLSSDEKTTTVAIEALSPASPSAFARTTIVFLETEDGERLYERFLARACVP